MRNTRLIIDQNAIARNMRALRDSSIQPRLLMAVVKANAYGHGDIDTARTALANGADALGVAIAEEGVRLRQAGIAQPPILILGAPDPEAVEDVIIHNITQTVFLPEHARMLEHAASKLNRTVNIHLKLETGMNRIGVNASALDELMNALSESKRLRVAGLFTHLAAADSMTPDDDEYTLKQIDALKAVVPLIQSRFGSVIIHAANSAGFLRFHEACLDMARVGIALYGAPPVPTDVPLLPAMRWVSRVSNVKDVEPDATVGYGRTFKTQQTTRVITIPVGYADGYHRALSNRGFMLVRGQRAPIVGRVCMDQCMADVTEIPGVSVGDEVVLLGQQENERITADELGTWAGTISYEILTTVTNRVPRVVLPAEPYDYA
ncbi:alanine racemase [Clostridia bacterium]|nr:alanine racemase [Clostridia bacterium]